jgi:type I restriction enzyme S subunit
MTNEQIPEGWIPPRGWRVVPLSEAVDQIDYGLSAPIPKNPPADGVKIVSTADITKAGRIRYDQIRHVSAPASTMDRLTLRDGDVLFNWRNSAELIGKTGVFAGQAERHIFASFILRIRCGETKSHNLFLAHLMNYYRQAEVFLHLARRAVNQANYNRNEISVLKIPLPPYDEQRKIARVLGLAQRAMEEHERLIALTTELKNSLLHQLFTQGFRGELQKQTDIGPVPESWEVVRLGDVAKLQSGGTPARVKPEYWIAGDIPWVKTGEIDYRVIDTTQEMITHEGLVNSAAKVFPKGTLLMAMYGQGVTRGRVGVLGIDAATNQACAAITPRDERRVSTRFIYHFLEFHYEDLRQMGHGANQRNLNAALIKGFLLSFPNPDDQARIVEALGILDKKLTLHQSKRAALSALFRTLLHQLMTAQIRVDDLI